MNPTSSETRDILFRVRRFDPGRDAEPYYQDFTVPVPPGMVVLEGLWWIKENLDATLSWRASCRMGVCGSCAMLVNGRPTLACNTQVLDVAERMLLLAPLPNFDIIRDLVPDLAPMLEGSTREVSSYASRQRGTRAISFVCSTRVFCLPVPPGRQAPRPQRARWRLRHAS